MEVPLPCCRHHDATTVATTLYSSDSNSSRDQAGAAVKFSVPTVSHTVYVAVSIGVDFYGLLTAAAPAASVC
jgi:hypothetical protein